MDKKYGIVNWPTEYNRTERLLEQLEDAVQSVYNVFNWAWFDRRTQKVKVRIDRQDTWSMDHTLAHIILPMLQQLQKTKHGAPYVDPDDCPKDLRPKEQDEYGTDDTHFARWDWVLDEMIYAFDSKVNKEEVYMRFDIATERDAMQKEQERISNGFKLFGKYYEGLWD